MTVFITYFVDNVFILKTIIRVLGYFSHSGDVILLYSLAVSLKHCLEETLLSLPDIDL